MVLQFYKIVQIVVVDLQRWFAINKIKSYTKIYLKGHGFDDNGGRAVSDAARGDGIITLANKIRSPHFSRQCRLPNAVVEVMALGTETQLCTRGLLAAHSLGTRYLGTEYSISRRRLSCNCVRRLYTHLVYVCVHSKYLSIGCHACCISRPLVCHIISHLRVDSFAILK